MPLFIDLHVDDNLTPDIIKQFHVADKAVQEKYGVRYLQILLNQPQGHLFCLIEGPDKESCAKVHQEAHGNIACNILEITESDFSTLLANKSHDESDFIRNSDGSIDTGNRIILSIHLIGSPKYYKKAKEIINLVFQEYQQINWGAQHLFENLFMAVFDSCTYAVDAGMRIRQTLLKNNIMIEIRMGVTIGPPLKEKGDLFEDARRSADHFAFVALNGRLVISSKAWQYYNGDEKETLNSLQIIPTAEEKFLNQVMECIEKMWNKNHLTVTGFAHELGMSKSQLTRKLIALCKLTPNGFFKEYRLRKSISLMSDHPMNIAEVTMAIGFTNPSYFAKCFRDRFGMSPSGYLITQNNT